MSEWEGERQGDRKKESERERKEGWGGRERLECRLAQKTQKLVFELNLSFNVCSFQLRLCDSVRLAFYAVRKNKTNFEETCLV